ncbi:MAG: ADP-ribosylglycohydrolase family protein [Ruminococcaceae bacterium]|nr:ADP-ribosylglycohydrolase family protein [Oscillospiraceae bacterium]
MKLSYKTYREKLNACYVGKTVGGTLGIPREGHLDVLPIDYYDPIPTEMLPNDDLDLQVSNLQIVMQHGLPVCRYHLGDTWRYYNRCSLPDEYGIARANYEKLLRAPLSGIYNNHFHGGMGSAIRSELWACLAPGDPDLAVRLAIEDACVDHYDDGILSAIFLAAIESAAFTESDVRKLIEIALSYLPADHRMTRAFCCTVDAWDKTHDPLYVRKTVLENYPSENWTDVTINLSFILTALLAAEGSFDRAICTAAELGYDADCTCATVGALFAIICPDSIDRRWTDPIGDELLLSENMTNMQSPENIGAFCDRVDYVARQVIKYYGSETELIDIPEDAPVFKMAPPHTEYYELLAYEPSEEKASLLTLSPLAATLVYPDEVAYAYDGREYRMTLRLTNTDNIRKSGTVIIRTAEGTVAAPDRFDIKLEEGESCELSFRIEKRESAARVSVNLLLLDFCLNGIKASVEAGFPDARRFTVEDLDSGKIYTHEATESAFKVPAGRYRYSIVLKPAVSRPMRLSVNGKASVTVFQNGTEVHHRDADGPYVPALHRGGRVDLNITRGCHRFDFVYDNSEARESYLDFGTPFGCGEWITTNEYK